MPFAADLYATIGDALLQTIVEKGVSKVASAATESPTNNYAEHGWTSVDTVSATQAELAAIEAFLERRRASNHPGNVVDEDGQLRAVHGFDPDLAPELMTKLAHIAKRLLGVGDVCVPEEPAGVYVYQFRINTKQPTTSSTSGKWPPHRDFDFWRYMDGMKNPGACIMHVLLTPHTVENGCVWMCDGSHVVADVPVQVRDEEDWAAGFREDLKYTVGEDLVENFAGGKTPMVGGRGEVVFRGFFAFCRGRAGERMLYQGGKKFVLHVTRGSVFSTI